MRSVPLRAVSSKEKALEAASMGQQRKPVIIIQAGEYEKPLVSCLTNVAGKIYNRKLGTEPEVFSGRQKAGFHQAHLLGLGTYISLYGKDQPLNQ